MKKNYIRTKMRHLAPNRESRTDLGGREGEIPLRYSTGSVHINEPIFARYPNTVSPNDSCFDSAVYI